MIIFNLVLNWIYWICLKFLVVFIFSNEFNWTKICIRSWYFLRLNTAVRSKSISNSCNTDYLAIFKSKCEAWYKQDFIRTRNTFRIIFNRDHRLSNLPFKLVLLINNQCMRISNNLYQIFNLLWVGFDIILF